VRACNANGDRLIDLSDAAFLFNYLFLGGAAPAAPFGACGIATEPASCVDFGACG